MNWSNEGALHPSLSDAQINRGTRKATVKAWQRRKSVNTLSAPTKARAGLAGTLAKSHWTAPDDPLSIP